MTIKQNGPGDGSCWTRLGRDPGDLVVGKAYPAPWPTIAASVAQQLLDHCHREGIDVDSPLALRILDTALARAYQWYQDPDAPSHSVH